MTKVVLTSSLTEQQAADMLAQGGVVVFGDQFVDAAAEFAKQVSGTPVLSGQRVADLKLTDTLMLYAVMVFAHTLPGGDGRPATQAELAAWKDKLFDRVDFIAGDEPMPNAEFALSEGTRDVTTILTWMAPATGDWQGVRTGQLRRIATQFEARHDRAMASGGASAAAPSGWRRFDHPDGLFSINYPSRMSEGRSLESGAALSCRSSDGREMIEVLVMEAGGQRHGDEVAQIAADGMVKDITSRPNGRVVHRQVTATGARGDCINLVGEHHEAGETYATEYLFVGAGRHALYVALKCPASRFAACKPEFDAACASLTTPWTDSTGHNGRPGQSEPRYSQAPPPVPPPTTNLNYNPPSHYSKQPSSGASEKRGGGGFQFFAALVLIAALSAAIWYFAF
jgi:hypothetical protein